MAECIIKGCSAEAYKNGLCREHLIDLVGLGRPGNDSDDGLSSIGEYAELHLRGFVLNVGKAAGKVMSLYDSITTLDADDASAIHWKKARSHYKKGRYNKAALILKKLLQSNPRNANAHYWYGVVSEEIGDYESSMQAYENTLEVQPEHVGACYRLGLIYSRRDDYERASKCFESVLELSPEHFEAHYRLGLAYDNMGKQDKAAASLEKCIEVNPRLVRAYQSLGLVYDGMGKHEKSIGCLKKALELQDM